MRKFYSSCVAFGLSVTAVVFLNSNSSFAQGQGGALWQPSGQNAAYTMRSIGIKTSSPLYDADVNGSLHSRTAVVDSILSCWEVMVSDILTVGNKLIVGGKISAAGISVTGLAESGSILTGNITSSNINADSISANHISATGLSTVSINSQNYYYNGNLINIPQIQSDIQNGKTRITALETTVQTHDSLLSNITSSQWQNNDTNIYFNSGFVGVGTSEPSETLEINGRVKITGTATGQDTTVTPPSPAPSKSIIIDGGIDRITATSGTLDFDNTNLTTTGNIQSVSITTANLTIIDRIESDTMHARKSLEVNNSIRLMRDTAEMYAEVSTNDTAVALMLQKDPSAPVVIGDAQPTPSGEARAKLTVEGNTRLNGELNVSGEVHANCVRTGCLHVTGETSFDSLHVAKTLKIGDNSMYLGEDEFGIPNNLWTDDGDLLLQSESGINHNTIINANNSGNVGIGSVNPEEKLDVVGNAQFDGNIILKSNANIIHSTSTAKLSFDNLGIPNNITLGYGNNSSEFKGLAIGSALPLLGGGSGSFFSLGSGSDGQIHLVVGANSNESSIYLASDLGMIYLRNTGGGDNLTLRGRNNVPSTWAAPSGVKIAGNVGIGLFGLQNITSRLIVRGTGNSSATSSLNITNLDGNSALFVRDDGNTGIGTETPNQKLDVAGDINVSASNGYRINNTAQSGYFLRGDGTHFVSSLIDASDIPANSNNYIQNQTGSPQSAGFNLSGNGTVGGNMIIGGNIGIGTTTASEKLDVIGNIKASSLAGSGTSIVLSDNTGKLSAQPLSASPVWSTSGNTGTNPSTNYIGTNDPADFVIKTNSTEQMRIKSSGFVGIGGNPQDKFHVFGNGIFDGNIAIGTTTPSEKLDVAGSIKSSDLSGTGNRIVTADESGKLTINAPSVNTNWNLNGNAGTSPSTNFIGTSDAQDLIFRTANAERMRITSAGDHPGLVGIGTATPQKQLHIYTFHNNTASEDATFSTASHWGIRLQDLTLSVTGTTINSIWDIEPKSKKLIIGKPNDPALTIDDDKNVGIGTTDPQSHLHISGSGNQDISISSTSSTSNSGTEGTPYLKLFAASSNNITEAQIQFRGRLGFVKPLGSEGGEFRMVINEQGNIGIGSTNPISKLEVRGVNPKSAGPTNVAFFGSNDASAPLGIAIDHQKSGSKYFVGLVGTHYGQSGETIWINGTMAVKYSPYGSNTGNVGIGTNDPQYKLDVAGQIRTCEVFLEDPNGWCDYVFEENYKMLSLNDLEKYLKRNKHLPNIPSAKQLEAEGGIHMGEMQKAMMEKIEELYLYTIDLNKKVEKLSEENKQLKAQVEKISNR